MKQLNSNQSDVNEIVALTKKIEQLTKIVTEIQKTMTKRFYTTREACEYLGMSRDELKWMREANYLPYVFRNGRYYFRLVDLENELKCYRIWCRESSSVFHGFSKRETAEWKGGTIPEDH